MISNLTKTLFLTISSLLVLFLMCTCIKKCQGNDIIQMENTSFHYRNYFDRDIEPIHYNYTLDFPKIPYFDIPSKQFDFELPQIKLSKEFSLDINFKVLDYFYWNNNADLKILSLNKQLFGVDQIPLPVWSTTLGVNLTNWLSVDYTYTRYFINNIYLNNLFPVQNSIQINVDLYRNKERNSFY